MMSINPFATLSETVPSIFNTGFCFSDVGSNFFWHNNTNDTS